MQSHGAGPGAVETSATIRIAGPNVVPEAITEATGVAPDFRLAVGNALPKTNTPARNGVWAIDSRGIVNSIELEVHIRALLERLPPAMRDHVPAGARFEVFCYWASSSGHGGPTLSSAIMGEMADRGLDLCLDLYSVDESS